MKQNVRKLEELEVITKQVDNSVEKLSAVEAKQQKLNIAVLDVLHDRSATLKEIVAETKLDKFIVLGTIKRINKKQTWIDFERIEGNFKKYFLVKITKKDDEC